MTNLIKIKTDHSGMNLQNVYNYSKSDEADSTPHIVTCKKCNQRNRLLKNDQRGDFKCCGCLSLLSVSFPQGKKNKFIIYLHLILNSRRDALWLSFIIIFIILISIVLPRMDKSSARHKNFGQVTSRAHSNPIHMVRQLPNNMILFQSKENGFGELNIQNGTGNDALVKIIDEGRGVLIYSLYIRGKNQAKIAQIPDGQFKVLFSSGIDWDGGSQSFTRDKSFMKFQESFKFITNRGENFFKFTKIDLILHSIHFGAGKTQHIDEAKFTKFQPVNSSG